MAKQDFKKLYYRLQEGTTWPNNYMFKFIVPNKNNMVDAVKALLPANGEFAFKHTKNLRHVSITCVARMDSADAVVEITENVSALEGVMIL